MSSKFLAIDPGTTESAYVVLDGKTILDKGLKSNDWVLTFVKNVHGLFGVEDLVIEMIASQGMPVGEETFETVFWIGRFFESFEGRRHRILRADVKLHLCSSPRAKDSNIRQSLIDIYGGSAQTKSGGALHGVASDIWQALAVGITWYETGKQSSSRILALEERRAKERKHG